MEESKKIGPGPAEHAQRVLTKNVMAREMQMLKEKETEPQGRTMIIDIIRGFRAKASAWKEKSEILYGLLRECSKGMKTLDKTEDDLVSLALLHRKSAPYSMVGYDSCCFGGCRGDKKCRVCSGNPAGCEEEAWKDFKKIHGDFCSLSEWIEFKLEQGIKFRSNSKMEMLQERIEIEQMELNELSLNKNDNSRSGD